MATLSDGSLKQIYSSIYDSLSVEPYSSLDLVVDSTGPKAWAFVFLFFSYLDTAFFLGTISLGKSAILR